MPTLMNVDFFNTFVLNKFSSRNGQNGTANYSVPSMGTLKFSKGCTTGSSWQRPIFSGGQNACREVQDPCLTHCGLHGGQVDHLQTGIADPAFVYEAG